MSDVTDSDPLGNLETGYRQAESAWQAFRDRRTVRDQLIRRKLPVRLPSDITANQEGIDYQTPELEKMIGDGVDVGLDNSPIWDHVLYEDGARAKKTVEEIVKWAARTWADMDSIRESWSEGQLRYGLGCSVLRWRPLSALPSEDDGHYRRVPFYWQDVDVLSIAVLEGDEEPEAFYAKFEMPVLEAVNKGYKLEDIKEHCLVGQPEAENSTLWDNKLTFIVRDARVPGKKCPVEGCDHDVREITEYCYGPKQNLDDAHAMERYPSPFKCCSFFLIPARKSSSRDPDERYLSPLNPAMTEAVIINWLETLVITMTRDDYKDRFYQKMNTIPDVVLQNEEIMTLLRSFKMPEGDDNSIPVLGELARFPKEISEHLMVLLQTHRDIFLRLTLARYPEHNEAQDMPSTSLLAQIEQAGKPWNRLYNHQDNAMRRAYMEGMFHAIKVWAITEPDIRFYASTSGKEKLRKGSSDAGQLLYVSAEKLSIDFDLSLETRAETLAEQGQRQLLAWDLYSKGIIDFDELLERCGIRDIEGMKRKLFEDRVEKQFAAKEDLMIDMVLNRLITVQTGIDLSALSLAAGQMAGAPVPGAGGAAPMGAPSPNGVPAAGAAPSSLLGRNISPPAIEGPSGGAGGLG